MTLRTDELNDLTVIMTSIEHCSAVMVLIKPTYNVLLTNDIFPHVVPANWIWKKRLIILLSYISVHRRPIWILWPLPSWWVGCRGSEGDLLISLHQEFNDWLQFWPPGVPGRDASAIPDDSPLPIPLCLVPDGLSTTPGQWPWWSEKRKKHPKSNYIFRISQTRKLN